MNTSVKKCLRNNFEVEWSTEKSNNVRCVLYNLLKPDHSQERYLETLSSADAITIANLRTNNCNVIAANKFKYSHAPNVVLTCPLCQSNEVANEAHYIY